MKPNPIPENEGKNCNQCGLPLEECGINCKKGKEQMESNSLAVAHNFLMSNHRLASAGFVPDFRPEKPVYVKRSSGELDKDWFICGRAGQFIFTCKFAGSRVIAAKFITEGQYTTELPKDTTVAQTISAGRQAVEVVSLESKVREVTLKWLKKQYPDPKKLKGFWGEFRVRTGLDALLLMITEDSNILDSPVTFSSSDREKLSRLINSTISEYINGEGSK
jgi:hypothetical protein